LLKKAGRDDLNRIIGIYRNGRTTLCGTAVFRIGGQSILREFCPESLEGTPKA